MRSMPLNDGLDDDSFRQIFRSTISDIMTYYDPGAIVLQCGADSLAGDRLGVFNLSLHGHADAVDFVKQFGRPLLVLGGGGYTVRNVARCWTNETGVILGEVLSDTLPYNKFFEYYQAGDYKLHIQPVNGFKNENSQEYLANIQERINTLLKGLSHRPGVRCKLDSLGHLRLQMLPMRPPLLKKILIRRQMALGKDERMTKTEIDEKV